MLCWWATLWLWCAASFLVIVRDLLVEISVVSPFSLQCAGISFLFFFAGEAPVYLPQSDSSLGVMSGESS